MNYSISASRDAATDVIGYDNHRISVFEISANITIVVSNDITPTLTGDYWVAFESGKTGENKDFSGKSACEGIPLQSHRAAGAGKIDFNNGRGASNEIARHINSRLLLNLVREYQPVSRADLMRRSGLQRSTISVITEQLIANHWLREGKRGDSIRGRRPMFLHLNENRLGVLGINLQHPSTHIGLADLNGRFVVRETIPTPVELDKFLHQISQIIRGWMGQFPFMQFGEIGLSLPGLINPVSRQFTLGPGLHWNAEDLRHKLESATGLNVCMETTANAYALSEMWFNPRLKNTRNIVVVAVSDSIGVGLIINGQLVRGRGALTGGFGHVMINENGPRCSCGHRGCWETFASNLAAVRYYNDLCSPRNRAKSFDELLRLVEQNDDHAVVALKQMSEYLGAGIAMLVSGFAPDFVSIAGDINHCWDKAGPMVTKAVQKRVFRNAVVNIIPGRSQPPWGLQGVISLVLQNHFACPVNS
jgi:predicted NBD/HSP70 family sugar kinase